MFSAFVAVEGFTLPERFIVKELTLMFENGEYNHFLFANPTDYVPTSYEETTIKYTTRNIHGLKYADGAIPYEKLEEVLSKLHNCDVYCYGLNTTNLIQKYIPYTPVTDIKNCGFTMPATLPSAECGRFHNGRHCSLVKAQNIKHFCMLTKC